MAHKEIEQSAIYKDMLSEVDKMLKIFFTFPVTNVTAERSFSSLMRLKTYLRSTAGRTICVRSSILVSKTVYCDSHTNSHSLALYCYRGIQ